MKYYRPVSLFLALSFAAVGIVFVAIPGEVVRFSNTISSGLPLHSCPDTGYSFYLILAAAYMYFVTVLASMMYRFPRDRMYPLLLVHSKSVSAVLSLGFFLFESRCLLYAANCIVDGAIAGLVFWFFSRMKKDRAWESS